MLRLEIMFSKANRGAFVLIMIAATIAVTPMLFFGNAWGHDFDIHVPAWMDAARQFREGILYPRWTAGADYGFGEPFFMFYPPLSWMMGGALGSILPWKMVPGVYVWLVLALAGVTMWKCASDWLDPQDAVIAGLLYAVNPYLIVMVYKRCSYGELLASAVFPLLVWAAVQLGRDAGKAALPLAVVFAAIWLADLPAGVVAAYSLAGLLLLDSLIHRSVRPLLYGAAVIAAVFASLAFFLIPAVQEQKWVNIALTLLPDAVPENNFLFAEKSDLGQLLFNWGESLIALLVMAVAAIGAVLSRRLRRNNSEVWWLLTALGGASTFLLFRPSLFLWRSLPELRYVGFPCRWLSPLCVVGAVLASSAFGQTPRKWKRALWVAAALAIGAIGTATVYSVRWDPQHHHMKDLEVATHSGAGYRGDESVDWARPFSLHPSKLPEHAPLIASVDSEDENELSRQGVQVHVERWSPEQKVFSVVSPRPLVLKIKLLTYPAWQATLNGKTAPLATSQETGQMLLPVPAGTSRAEIKFVRTRDRVVGNAVSLISALVLIPLMLVLRQRERAASRSLGRGLDSR